LDLFRDGYLQHALKAYLIGSKPYPQKSPFPHPKSTIQATMQRGSVTMHCDASLQYSLHQTALSLLVSTVCMKDKNLDPTVFQSFTLYRWWEALCCFCICSTGEKSGKYLVTQDELYIK